MHANYNNTKKILFCPFLKPNVIMMRQWYLYVQWCTIMYMSWGCMCVILVFWYMWILNISVYVKQSSHPHADPSMSCKYRGSTLLLTIYEENDPKKNQMLYVLWPQLQICPIFFISKCIIIHLTFLLFFLLWFDVWIPVHHVTSSFA